jgi:FAD/FMN-containing dehydrogenase
MKLKDIFKSTWELAETRDVKKDVRYWEAQDFLTESVYPYFYQEKSSYMKAANITDDVVAAMFDWAASRPGTSMQSAFKFFQLGGAINRMKPTETAYVHRGFDWLFTLEANWWRPVDTLPLVEANLDWQQNFYADINQRAKAVGAFQNFSDPSLKDWQQAYYGENYRKLMGVKKAVDPHMLFNFPQAIQPG